MESNPEHNLKRILIRLRLLSFFLPIYERFVKLIPISTQQEKDNKRKMLDFYSQFIKPGDLCFDIGAYKGSRSEVFRELGAKTIAVEPQPKYVAYLQEKFMRDSKVIVVAKGLADKEGELPLLICEEADGLSTFSNDWGDAFPGYQWNEKKIVPITTLDNLAEEFGKPVFCKIDVEGFELQVLEGLTRPIKYLSFEFTKKLPQKIENCLNYLSSLGYCQFNFHFGEPEKLFFPNWVSTQKIVEEIKSNQNNILSGDIYAKF